MIKDEINAEKAIEDLRTSGFSENEVGIAIAHQEGEVSNFWHKITSKFGKHERRSTPLTFMNRYSNPEYRTSRRVISTQS